VRLVEARHKLASSVPLGHVCALTFSAVGLVYCAFGGRDRVMPLVDRELAQSRAVGRRGVPKTKAELERLIATVRTQGFATVAEGDGGLAAVSAPVLDPGQRLQLALTVFGRPGRLDVAPKGPVAALMAETARKLGGELYPQQ
jgi:DNA-binding IclR family transcriptional regulator